mmetsp:Transcript_23542/g.48841  ORF Transcript_23542/g.48841 Transcript_23542/m.48841 type:complete len:253 (-) Transcript_23542:57-815(-)
MPATSKRCTNKLIPWKATAACFRVCMANVEPQPSSATNLPKRSPSWITEASSPILKISVSSMASMEGLRSVLVPPLPQRSTGAKAQVGGFTPEAVQFVMVLPHPLHALGVAAEQILQARLTALILLQMFESDPVARHFFLCFVQVLIQLVADLPPEMVQGHCRLTTLPALGVLLGFVALMSVDTQHLLLFVQVVLQFLHLPRHLLCHYLCLADTIATALERLVQGDHLRLELTCALSLVGQVACGLQQLGGV